MNAFRIIMDRMAIDSGVRLYSFILLDIFCRVAAEGFRTFPHDLEQYGPLLR